MRPTRYLILDPGNVISHGGVYRPGASAYVLSRAVGIIEACVDGVEGRSPPRKSNNAAIQHSNKDKMFFS